MRYLVIEDFNTCGLTGDVQRTDAPTELQSQDERFFAFVRSEGYTNKAAGRGGSWGIGKTVFARSSDINTTLMLSIRRESPSCVLIGQSLLKYHGVGNERFAPEVMWGTRSQAGEPVLPLGEGFECESFRHDFSLGRRGESGLSVVIPCLNREITASALLRHTLLEYFLPILRGKLVVEIAGADIPDEKVVVDAATLRVGLGGAAPDLPAPLLKLAAWLASSPSPYITRPAGPGVPGWEELLPAADARALATRFNSNEPIALRIGINVRKRAGAVAGQFDVVLVQSEETNAGKPVYIRDGIRIPKARASAPRGQRVHAIVLCEGNALAEMLRDAEGPGHTHWSSETQGTSGRFKDIYIGGQSLIRLVEGAPKAITDRLQSTLQERDKTTFAADFPMPANEEEKKARRRKKRRQPTPPTPDETIKVPQPRPRAFTIETRKGGFVIRRDNPAAPRPHRLHIRVAYDRTRGNPFKHYHPADFKLSQSPIKVAMTGCAEVTRHENILKVQLTADDFRIEVQGFDLNRDVEVDARAESPEGSPEPLDVPDDSDDGGEA